MVKQATKTQPPKKAAPPPPERKRGEDPRKANLPAKRPEAHGGLPASLRDRARKDVGKGSSKLAEDNLIPLIYVLQPNSPQVNERGMEHIPGAKPGSFWLRGADDPIVDGEEGAEFQPCYFGKEWLEWLPNRGGFVGRHDRRPREAVQVPHPTAKGRMIWQMPSGNDVVETRFYAGFIRRVGSDERPLPYILPFKGTGHGVARDWMTQINAKFDAGGQEPDPSFLHRYHLTTRFRENDQGQWFQIAVGYLGPIGSDEEYDRGFKLNAAFESGAVRADVDGGGSDEPQASSTSTDDDM